MSVVMKNGERLIIVRLAVAGLDRVVETGDMVLLVALSLKRRRRRRLVKLETMMSGDEEDQMGDLASSFSAE